MLGAVDMADGLGTKLTHATSTMSTSASESSGRTIAIEAEIAACCRTRGGLAEGQAEGVVPPGLGG